MPESSEDSRDLRRYLLVVLGAVFFLRLPLLFSPFVYPDEWALSGFLIFARNYAEQGWLLSGTIPYSGVVGGEPMLHSNHPWLVPILLSLWGLPFSYSELALRSFALLFALGTTVAVFQIGTLLRDQRTGLIACTLYALAPLSLHFAGVVSFEPPHLCFILWGLVYLMKWESGECGWMPCAGFLTLAQLSDVFGLFFAFWLLLMALYRATRSQTWKPLVAFASIPIITQVILMLIVRANTPTFNALSKGAGRIGYPWNDWFTVDYWTSTLWKLNFNFAYLLPIASLLLLLSWPALKLDTKKTWPLGFVWFFPLLYTLLGTEWMKRHFYLVLFFGPAMALHFACWLRQRKFWLQASLVALQLALSIYYFQSSFAQPFALHYREIRQAELLKQEVAEKDLVVGLPSHMAYYLHHSSIVLFNHFLSASLVSEEAVFTELRRLAEGYDRVFIFPQFLELNKRAAAINFEKLFPEDSGYKLISRPRSFPVVWSKLGTR